MRTRAESFGAWVHVDEPPMLVAVDREFAARLGVDGAVAWGPSPPSPRPLEAHVAITSKCAVGCVGCYQDATPGGDAPPREDLEARLAALASDGVFVVAFGGGEPLTRDDLPEIARAARRHGLVPVMTTSGMGLTDERARTLTDFAQINVSYDGERDAYRDVRGVDGAEHAERAMTALAAAGIRFGINLVLTRRTFDRVPDAVRRARELGASEVQLLRFKPAGRGTGLVYLESRLDAAQVARFCDLVDALVTTSGLSVRIDCALVPFLSTRFSSADALSTFGVLGCEAGRWLASVDTTGARGPCSFYRGDDVTAVAARWSRHSDTPPDPCASCGLVSVCRGGCRVVAHHAGDDRAPDPECPRVVAWRAHA